MNERLSGRETRLGARFDAPEAAYALIAAAVAAGFGLRIWILASPLGQLDFDEASVGLIARHFLEGEFPLFVWGQPYGGNQEAVLTALVFAITGSGTLQLKLVEVALFAAAAVVVWRLGIRAVGERAAVLGALVFWVWPGFLVYWSTKANGYYAFALLCEAVALLLVFRLSERDSVVDAALLGFVLAQGVWASLSVAVVALPFLAWLVVNRPATLRLAAVAMPAFLISYAPVLVWNATHDWRTFTADPHFRETTVDQRLRELFEIVIPSWFGVRTPYSLEWFPVPAVAFAFLGVVAVAFMYLCVKRPAHVTPLLLSCAVFPIFYALSPFAGYVVAPKYLVVLAPVIALLIGWLLAQHRLLALGLALALAASVASLLKIEQWGLFVRGAPDRPVPANIEPLLDELERLRVTRVLTDPAIASRITFESEERIIAAGGWGRYEPHNRLVRLHPFPANVFVRGARTEREARQRLLNGGYERRTSRDFVIYVHP